MSDGPRDVIAERIEHGVRGDRYYDFADAALDALDMAGFAVLDRGALDRWTKEDADRDARITELEVAIRAELDKHHGSSPTDGSCIASSACEHCFESMPCQTSVQLSAAVEVSDG